MTALPVLIAEDDAILAYALELVVSEAGHNVIGPFATAAAAMEALGQIGPEVAFVDIGLDGLTNGVALAQILTARYGTLVYLVSGDRATGLASHGAAYGFIEKPAAEDVFAAALKHAIAVRDGNKTSALPDGVVRIEPAQAA